MKPHTLKHIGKDSKTQNQIPKRKTRKVSFQDTNFMSMKNISNATNKRILKKPIIKTTKDLSSQDEKSLDFEKDSEKESSSIISSFHQEEEDRSQPQVDEK